MSSLVIRQLPLLEVLAKVKSKSRKFFLKNCELTLIKAIIECVHNVLKKNVLLEESRIKKLKKHKKTLRDLANANNTLKHKKKVILQSGGNFLPVLLRPIVSYLFDQLANENPQ